MDEPELPTSPRKKLKVEEPSFEGNFVDTVMLSPESPSVNPHHGHQEAPNDLPSKQIPIAPEAQLAMTDTIDNIDDRYNKEAACGITEFVSPDLLGFSGILKKR